MRPETSFPPPLVALLFRGANTPQARRLTASIQRLFRQASALIHCEAQVLSTCVRLGRPVTANFEGLANGCILGTALAASIEFSCQVPWLTRSSDLPWTL